MEYVIKPEDEQDLFNLTEILKDANLSKQLKIAMRWYVRGQADALMIAKESQPTCKELATNI